MKVLRLTDEEVKKLKECATLDLADATDDRCKAFFRGVLRVVETMEALQVENKELCDKYDKLNDFEQSQCAKLLAQNGVYRELLAKAREALRYYTDTPWPKKASEVIDEIDKAVGEA